MRGSRKFCQKGTNSTFLLCFFFRFLVDEGREDPNITKSRPLNDHFIWSFTEGLDRYND